jgi:ABC-2 type transport system permease protein
MKLLRDTGLIYRRYLGILLSNPAWVIIGVLQPVLYLLLFAPLLKPTGAIFGFSSEGPYNFFVPGLLVQLGLFGAAGVGFSLISELRLGVVERFRVSPVSRTALLFGRALRDVTTIIVQSLILILLALPFGLTINVVGVLVMLALVALIGLAMASICYAVALALKSEDSYAPLVFTASLPLLLLSGVLLPISQGDPSRGVAGAPQWLIDISDVNPLKYAVDAGRQIFVDNLANGTVLTGVLLMGGLAIIMVVIAARAFSRAIA